MTEFVRGQVPGNPEELPKYLEEMTLRLEETFSRSSDVQSFTPELFAVTTQGTLNYNQQVGRYRVRDGREVQFNLYLDWDTWTGTGAMAILGFPVPMSAFVGGFTPVMIWHSGLTMPVSTVLQGYVSPTGTGITLNSVPVGGGAALPLAVSPAGIILASGSYFID